MKENEPFCNRELSWLEFNHRVLEQAENLKNPLFERMKFLSITGSNLDEFYMVRVASVKDQIDAGYSRPDASGNTPEMVYQKLSDRVHKMTEEQYKLYHQLREAAKNKIRIVPFSACDGEKKRFLKDYFEHTVYPVLTPVAIERDRPFPLILNKSLNIGVMLKNERDELLFATVQVPSVLDRLIYLEKGCCILLEDVIAQYLHKLFPGYKVLYHAVYRVTRNADLALDEEDDIVWEMENLLKKRQWGKPVRLEIRQGAVSGMVSYLQSMLQIDDKGLFLLNGPPDLAFLTKLRANLPRYPGFVPRYPRQLRQNLFEAIRQKDQFLHHPYDSFDPVVDFVEEASRDESVLAIKQTLYRVSGNSPIIKALKRAAQNGKQVSVLVELKARFDEENNIHWARELEQAGCHVFYGVKGLKTHCKILLIVKKDPDGIRRYVHLGTGNYNDVTAKQYTDMGYFTCREEFGADATALFNSLSGYYKPKQMYQLTCAPEHLKEKLLSLIRQEAETAKNGKKAGMILKMNSLVDTGLIHALYEASCQGVKIDLIVRGICCLMPGVKGFSENISVHSIVGRFLEHSRIFYFCGSDSLFLSSADWMPRNLYKRVELMFPVRDEDIKKKITGLLNKMLKDTDNTSIMQPNGKYKKLEESGYNIQKILLEEENHV